ncbi:MAG: hypothetical protein Q8L52_04075, partial [bacterium]|nr:hypothetical protein [bacterium]
MGASNGGGGGGACAYYLNSSSIYQYILCVGGGGGGVPDYYSWWYTGTGVTTGGSTAGTGVGNSGYGEAMYAATRNGSGAGGSTASSYGSYDVYGGGSGGAPGHGGYAHPTTGGGGGGGGDIFSSAGNGGTSVHGIYLNMASYGGYLLGGGMGGGQGGGGGGGYGGGGGGGCDSFTTSTAYDCVGYGGGGGSSYFHSSLSAPDSSEYVSIPVSALGSRMILLAAGKGGWDGDVSPSVVAQSGTITMKYLCSAKAGTSCSSSANSCSQTSTGTYDCSENCVDWSGAAVTTPANPYFYNNSAYSCSRYSDPNACGQTTDRNASNSLTGLYDCNMACTLGTKPNPPPDSNCPAPDLAASAVNSTSAIPGQITTLSGTITNLGTGAAADFQNMIRVWNVKNGITTWSDFNATSPSKLSLAVGGSDTVFGPYTFDAPSTLTNIYKVQVCANFDLSTWKYVVPEVPVDHANNCTLWTPITVSCPAGTGWNGSSCAPITGNITPGSCTIAIGASTCQMNFSWTSTGVTAPSNFAGCNYDSPADSSGNHPPNTCNGSPGSWIYNIINGATAIPYNASGNGIFTRLYGTVNGVSDTGIASVVVTPNCELGSKWNSISGTCAAYLLTTSTLGTGTGSISASVPDNAGKTNCALSGCTYSFGTPVTLTASASPGSTFTGWGGTCAGTTAATCTVTMNAAKSVTATFADNSPTLGQVTISSPTIIPDNSTPYAIKISGSDSGGVGKVYMLGTLINWQGGNAGLYRGYLMWNSGSSYFSSVEFSQSTSCGGGTAVNYNGYGSEYLNLDSCSVSNDVGNNTRTVSFNVRFTPLFATNGPAINNDISGFVYDNVWQGGIWTNFDINFNLAQYTLTTTVSGSVGGSISVSPGGISGCTTSCSSTPLGYGTSVSVVATPSPGYSFTGWGGACTGTTNTCIVTMSASKTVTATFTAIPPPVATLSQVLNPSISGQYFTVTWGSTGGPVTSCVVEKTPNRDAIPIVWNAWAPANGISQGTAPASPLTRLGPGEHQAWRNTCTGPGGTSTIKLDHDVIPNYLTVIKAGTAASTGSVVADPGDTFVTPTKTDCTTPGPVDPGCDYRYHIYDTSNNTRVITTVKLTATAGTGSTFTSWSGGGCSGAAPTCTVIMDGSGAVNGQKKVTATFTLNTYTVTYNANSATSGTIPASQTKTYGTDLTLATNSGNLARTGYTFSG